MSLKQRTKRCSLYDVLQGFVPEGVLI